MTIWRWGAPVVNRGNFPEVSRLQREMDGLWNMMSGAGTELESGSRPGKDLAEKI